MSFGHTANRFCRLCRQALVVAAWCGVPDNFIAPNQSHAVASEPIAVAVESGRIFTGEVDARTNDTQLWLRQTQPGITLNRLIDWNSIVLAQRDERQLSAAELQAQVDELKSSEVEAGLLPDAAAGQTTSIEEVPRPKSILPQPWQPDTQLSHYIQAARENNTQVCSLSIDAHVAQWSRTVQSNGIILHVYPLDGLGRMVAVDGTLDVDLIAQVPPGLHQGISLPRIGHWTVRLTPDQFCPAGAVVKLPFQSVQPEFDLQFGPYGLVHATLNVPGSGSYETSQAMLRIRPYSAVRDEEQQLTGHRYFDVERVDRWAP